VPVLSERIYLTLPSYSGQLLLRVIVPSIYLSWFIWYA